MRVCFRCALALLVLVGFLRPGGVDAEILNSLTGETIPGTEGVEPGPDIVFKDANLVDADFSQANLARAIFHRADLTNADFSQAILMDTEFLGATLNNANLSQVDFAGTDFFRGKWKDGKEHSGFPGFRRASLVDANLSGANLVGGDFELAVLTNADLSEANLAKASFWEATLTNANFTDAILNGALFCS